MVERARRIFAVHFYSGVVETGVGMNFDIDLIIYEAGVFTDAHVAGCGTDASQYIGFFVKLREPGSWQFVAVEQVLGFDKTLLDIRYADFVESALWLVDGAHTRCFFAHECKFRKRFLDDTYLCIVVAWLITDRN
jgi:hypothetical protein